MKQRHWLILTAVLLRAAFGTALSEAASDEPTNFEKQIRPILKANCFQCHGEGEKLNGRLDVRLRRLIAQGGESGPAIVPGQPLESPLYQRVSKGEMPPGKKMLAVDEVSIIGRWIAEGAPPFPKSE